MNREQKELLVNTLKQDFKDSQASFLIVLKGIPVAKVQQLRRGLKANGGKLKVAKARLMKIAVKDIACAKDLTPYLKDQLGVVFADQNPLSTIKVLYNFSKENEKLKLVAGCFESKVVEREYLDKIATLPSREVLLAQLCGVLKAPIVKLAHLMDAIAQKKSESKES